MSLNTFTPEVWSAGILSALEKSLVFGGLISRDYEGEIKAFGDRVRINSISDPTISSYTKDTDINTPEALVGADQVLVVDQAKYFNFAVDDIDKAQNRPGAMIEGTQRAGYKLRDTVDSFLAGFYTAASVVQGSDGSPITPNSTAGTAPYDYLVTAGKLLTKNNVPTMGRWAVITPDAHALMLADTRFVGYATSFSADILQNGKVGRAAGFDIYVSNNVAVTGSSNYAWMMGVNAAWNYAGQITEMEAYRPERRFSDALKGLMVYGAKVTRPDCLGVLYSTL
jgi:hypothetical protein